MTVAAGKDKEKARTDGPGLSVIEVRLLS